MGARASTQLLAATMALVLALCLLVLPGTPSNAQTLPPGEEVDDLFKPGQLIVKLVDGEEIEDINLDYGTQVKDTFPDAFPDGENIYLLKVVGEDQRAEDVLEEMRDEIGNSTSSRLVYAELNLIFEAPEDPEADARHRAFPNDGTKPSPDNYSEQYADSALNLSGAHAVSKGGGTRVAVLDTGAQLGHPRLKKSFKGVARRDFVGDDKDPSEPKLARNKERRQNEVVGHGTHVAGIVDLVAPKAEIMPLRVLNRKGRGNVFDIARAVVFAKNNEADVINLSLGTPDPTLVGLAPPELLRETVDEAIDNGVVVVAAAGNLSTGCLPEPPDPPGPYYPAARGTTSDREDGLLAVTSVDEDEKRSCWANYGTWVDIAAPGEGILSSFPGGRYAHWSGTSMATPFVAGQAALIREENDALDPENIPRDIEKQIRCGARPLVGEPPGTMGAGHTDIGRSLGQDGPEPDLCPSS